MSLVGLRKESNTSNGEDQLSTVRSEETRSKRQCMHASTLTEFHCEIVVILCGYKFLGQID